MRQTMNKTKPWPQGAKCREETKNLITQTLSLISFLCCHLGNHAFSKPIIFVVLSRLGNHDFRQPTTDVSFQKPINTLGQILRQEASLSPHILVSRDIYKLHFFHRPLEPGYSVKTSAYRVTALVLLTA